MSSAPTLPPAVEPTWDDQLAAITAYVEQNEGKFPANRSDDPQVAALGCWWVAQNISLTRDKMSPGRRTRLDKLRDHARKLRGEAKRRRAEQVARRERERFRALSATAGAAGAIAAGKALKNPYLVPGDAKVLQLRIDHPEASLAELAALAGVPKGRFEAKYYGALHRGPHSLSPLKKDLKDRLLTLTEAADVVGVSRTILNRWVEAGLMQIHSRNHKGQRRFLGAEAQRVRKLIEDGWPDEFKAGGEPRPRRRRAR